MQYALPCGLYHSVSAPQTEQTGERSSGVLSACRGVGLVAISNPSRTQLRMLLPSRNISLASCASGSQRIALEHAASQRFAPSSPSSSASKDCRRTEAFESKLTHLGVYPLDTDPV